MAPPSADIDTFTAHDAVPDVSSTKIASHSKDSTFPKPLVYSGSLDEYKSFEATPVIGREYPEVQLTDILKDDAKIRDLAIIVSQRNVVFFRDQNITIEEQKVLGQKLGELSGKPASSKLHKHAVANGRRGIAVGKDAKFDDEISIISSEQNQKLFGDTYKPLSPQRLASHGWHADITFERIPSDYAILKLNTLPADGSGGDTIWASGYEAYDRLSETFKKVTEGLTATHHQPYFARLAKTHGIELIEENRGSPENSGVDFTATHPLIRTNPVTGWKSLFAAGAQIVNGRINGVSDYESDLLKSYFTELITLNHDLQVRFKWNKNDVAIWDNRSSFHTGTNDFQGTRQGERVVSIGEKPFFDPNSVSRREALWARQ